MTAPTTIDGAMMTDEQLDERIAQIAAPFQDDRYGAISFAKINGFARALLSASKPAGHMERSIVQWLRRNASAEQEPKAKAALIEAHNAALAIIKDNPAAPSANAQDERVAFAEYRRGVKEAFHIANMINANRQGRTAEETCSYLIRNLATLANGGEARAAQQSPSHPTDAAAPAQSGGAVPTLWEAFEMGFGLRGAMLGHVLDGRDVGRLTTCEFWHPSMLGMHEGTDLHVGLTVSEAIVKLKTEVRRRLNALDAGRDLSGPSAVVLDDERATHLKGHASFAEMVDGHVCVWREAIAHMLTSKAYDRAYVENELKALAEIETACQVELARAASPQPVEQTPALKTELGRRAWQATATQPAQTEEMIRFCPECGCLGDIPGGYHACCPDSSHARVVPKRFAELCRDTFKLCVSQPYPLAQTERALTDEQREQLKAIGEERARNIPAAKPASDRSTHD